MKSMKVYWGLYGVVGALGVSGCTAHTFCRVN